MPRIHLTVDDPEIPALELPHEPHQRDFRCVRNPREHGFAKKYASHRNAVETASELAIYPRFDRMRDPEFVQLAIDGQHFRSDPCALLYGPRLGARVHDGAK